MSIARFYESGGFGMYPTTFLGLATLGASIAVLFLRRPAPIGGLVLLGVSVLGSGILGFVTGMATVFTAIAHVSIQPPDRVPLLFAGTGEALLNLVLAFGFLVPATVLVAGAYLKAHLRGSAKAKEAQAIEIA